jgi:hypothetical protein
MSKQPNRRIFLRGLGGAVVTAPFLGSLAQHTALAQTNANASIPKRLIVMFTHYGCVTTRFFPAKAHGTLTAADLEPTTLKHLAPFASKLLIPRGIRAMNEWTASLARGQGNDPHTQVAGSFFTCQPVTPNSDDPFSFAPETKARAKPMGPSLDHVVAQQINANGSPLYMRVGNLGENTPSAVSYSAAEENFPGVGSPAQVFSSLTGLFKDDQPMSPDTYQAIRGKSVIDLVKTDLETLERFDMSLADKQKLAAWKELLHQTGGMVASAQCNEELALQLGLTRENVDSIGGAAGMATDAVTSKITDTLDVADIYSSVAVLSAMCDYNRVIFLKYPGNYIFRGLGQENENHNLSHRIGNAGMQGTCVGGVLDMLQALDDYYARKFAHLVGLLDGINEGEGKLLDNCAAVWFQEMSDGNAHNLNNLPIVQAGSCGGYFKTGWAVNVEDGAPTMSNGNSELLCADGASDEVNGTTQSTGTPATVANAPINKYYVGLMNALGVKAGSDGYPLKGGMAEVTHFGRYDKTEDFVGGGTKPAKINSPGAFDALKANV